MRTRPGPELRLPSPGALPPEGPAVLLSPATVPELRLPFPGASYRAADALHRAADALHGPAAWLPRPGGHPPRRWCPPPRRPTLHPAPRAQTWRPRLRSNPGLWSSPELARLRSPRARRQGPVEGASSAAADPWAGGGHQRREPRARWGGQGWRESRAGGAHQQQRGSRSSGRWSASAARTSGAVAGTSGAAADTARTSDPVEGASNTAAEPRAGGARVTLGRGGRRHQGGARQPKLGPVEHARARSSGTMQATRARWRAPAMRQGHPGAAQTSGRWSASAARWRPTGRSRRSSGAVVAPWCGGRRGAKLGHGGGGLGRSTSGVAAAPGRGAKLGPVEARQRRKPRARWWTPPRETREGGAAEARAPWRVPRRGSGTRTRQPIRRELRARWWPPGHSGQHHQRRGSRSSGVVERATSPAAPEARAHGGRQWRSGRHGAAALLGWW